MSHDEIDHIYRTLLPLRVEHVTAHADLIAGTLETIADLVPVLEEIEARLRQGERP